MRADRMNGEIMMCIIRIEHKKTLATWHKADLLKDIAGRSVQRKAGRKR